MTIWYSTDDNEDKPSTHVLVIGISHYQYLPDTPDHQVPDDGRVTLGLSSVTTPAISSFRFAKWMQDHYSNPDAQLGSIRMLLAPSDKEVEEEQELGNLDDDIVNRPKRENVLDALHAWKADCEKYRDNVAVLYIAGHGIQLNKDDSIVLLEDFGRPNRNVLEGAVDIGSIWRGMADNNTARKQYYFVDACRTKPGLFKQYLNTPTGVSLDVGDGGVADTAPIFFSAAPRNLALGEPGIGTLFCQALLSCLKSVAAKPDQDAHWVVSTASLIEKLPAEVERLAKLYHEEQTAVVGGQLRNQTFHYLDDAPDIPLSIALDPGEAAPDAHCRLTYGEHQDVVLDEQLHQSPRNLTAKAGLYILSVDMSPDSDYQSRTPYPFAAMPPRHSEEVSL